MSDSPRRRRLQRGSIGLPENMIAVAVPVEVWDYLKDLGQQDMILAARVGREHVEATDQGLRDERLS